MKKKHFAAIICTFLFIATIGSINAATIDIMTVNTIGGYSQTYDPAGSSYYSEFMTFGKADDYFLNDGSSWESGAGSYLNAKTAFQSYEVTDDTIEYTFASPESGILFQNTDYNSGDHSAQGTLGIVDPLSITAEIGSDTATMTGYTKILSNDETWYGEPRFNYYSADVGDMVYFEMTYTLLGTTWTEDLFNECFKYNLDGFVDFTKTASAPVPEPSAVLLIGIGIFGLMIYQKRKNIKRFSMQVVNAK